MIHTVLPAADAVAMYLPELVVIALQPMDSVQVVESALQVVDPTPTSLIVHSWSKMALSVIKYFLVAFIWVVNRMTERSTRPRQEVRSHLVIDSDTAASARSTKTDSSDVNSVAVVHTADAHRDTTLQQSKPVLKHLPQQLSLGVPSSQRLQTIAAEMAPSKLSRAESRVAQQWLDVLEELSGAGVVIPCSKVGDF